MDQASSNSSRDVAPVPYKVGWYQIGCSGDFPPGRVVKLRYLDREFVAFRDGEGRVAVFDPHCPHLGAHLGDARIVDGTLQCPFHGWRFRGDGCCTAIPYAGSVPARARARVWDTCEVHGDVYLYYDPEHRAPAYEVPSIPGFAPSAFASYRNQVDGRLQPYDLYENSVDTGHFVFIHGFTELPSIRLEATPWVLRTVMEGIVVNFGFLRHPVRFLAGVHGPGISLTWIETGLRLWTYLNVTPIEPRKARVFVTNFLEKTSAPWLLRPLVIRLFSWGFMFNLRRDVGIFSKRENPAHPVLCEGDGPIISYRNWFTALPDAVTPPTPQFSVSQRRPGGRRSLLQETAADRCG